MKSILMIWDIDGTLINPRGSGRQAMNKAFHAVYGVENAFEGISMSGRLDGVIVRDAFNKYNVSESEIYSFYNAYCKVLEETMLFENPIELLPGVEGILTNNENLNKVYHVLGTGNLEKGARIKLSAHNLNRFFPTGGFGDEKLERWEIISKAITEAEKSFELKFEKANIYVIGDTPFDIECGKVLGVNSIAVATGSHSLEELLKHGADYTFESLMDTKRFLSVFE